ncbi:MAG: TetR/AcrR family transcriptional regulator [Gemmatimonadetes bacterium]|nr:TetR/AcrR family transcriptional regulator [Gemmatimonadota bacterium]
MKFTDPVSDRLLAVARDLFTRRGYEGTSVRAITARARANLGAITYHFGSKQALYHAALESMTEPLVERIAAGARTAGSPLDRIEAMMRSFLEHVADNPGAPACLLRELASERPLAPPIAQVMKRNLGTLAQTIAAGQQDGSIRAGDPFLLAMSVVAQPFYITVASRVIKEALGVDSKDPATRARIINHVAETIRRSLTNEP